MAKRIAKIYLPFTANDGESLDKVHADLRDEVCLRYGGVTTTIGTGSWFDDGGMLYSKFVSIFEFAADDSVVGFAEIAKIANRYGREAKQRAVAYVLPNGEFRIDDITQR